MVGQRCWIKENQTCLHLESLASIADGEIKTQRILSVS